MAPNSETTYERDAQSRLLPSTPIDASQLRVDWLVAPFMLVTPLVAIVALLALPMLFYTYAFSVVYGHLSGFSITAGYHRLWSHRAYKAALPLRLFMAILGASAFQGSIHWWCRKHRAHHRYTDTDYDPHGVHRGLFWAHLGWMIFRPTVKMPHVDMADLEADPVVRWQHRNYVWLSFLMTFGLPTLAAGLGWGDWLASEHDDNMPMIDC